MVRPAYLVQTFAQLPCCNSWFLFTDLSPLLLHILQRWCFSFSCTQVSFRIATISHSELFLGWWPSDVLQSRSYWECRSLAVFQYTIQFFCFFPLYGNSRQHWPSEVHCVQSSHFRSFCVLSIASRIFFWVPFPSCCPLKWPVFVAGIEMDLFLKHCSSASSSNTEKTSSSHLVSSRSLARCLHSTGLSWSRCSQQELRLFHWSWHSQRSCKRFVFLPGIVCPVVPSALPCRLASWNRGSETSWEHPPFFFKSVTSKLGIFRPKIELDNFSSSIFSAESISLIHTIASVGKLELEQTSLWKCIFQITKDVEFGTASNSLLLASLLESVDCFAKVHPACCNRRLFSCSW